MEEVLRPLKTSAVKMSEGPQANYFLTAPRLVSIETLYLLKSPQFALVMVRGLWSPTPPHSKGSHH